MIELIISCSMFILGTVFGIAVGNYMWLRRAFPHYVDGKKYLIIIPKER